MGKPQAEYQMSLADYSLIPKLLFMKKNILSSRDDNIKQVPTSQKSPLPLDTQNAIPKENKETKMKLTTLATSVLISSALVAGSAQARPNMTDEELTKARHTASQLKPAINLDELLDEADRLGVICDGDLGHRVVLKTCAGNVKIAQSRERQAKLDEDNAKLDQELKDKVNALAKSVDKKLNQ